jgi:hypothetical protein
MRYLSIMLAFVGCFGATLPLTAQVDKSLVGARVRVTPTGPEARPVVGTLLGVPGDSLLIGQADGTRQAILRAEVAKVERSVARQSGLSRGVTIGGLIGLGLGVGLDVLVAAECAGQEGWDAIGCPTPGGYVLAPVMLAGTAAAIGGLIGSAGKQDVWQEVIQPRLADSVRQRVAAQRPPG